AVRRQRHLVRLHQILFRVDLLVELLRLVGVVMRYDEQLYRPFAAEVAPEVHRRDADILPSLADGGEGEVRPAEVEVGEGELQRAVRPLPALLLPEAAVREEFDTSVVALIA